MIYIIALFLIEILLFLTNYKPGTFLIGWDNIMPEFNLALNFKRSLFGVWQDYRGLGFVDGMAYTANLMHTIYIWILSLVLPQSSLRYVFISLTHLAGGIAFFYLAQHFIKNKKVAFLGALFYMFNLGIIQMYFAPLEAFAIHFAALPLLVLCITKVLEKPNKKNYLFLFFATLLTTPQAFVTTLIIVFLMLISLILIIHVITRKTWKRALSILLIFIAANAFWLIPYTYSVKYNAQVIPNTRINQFSSEEIFYRNKAFGGLTQVFTLKGFMMDAVEYDKTQDKNIYFMQAWRAYTNNPIFISIFSISLLIAGLGILNIVKRKSTQLYPFIIAFGVSLLFLANSTPLLEQINNLIRYLFPVIGEAFRFPFTKFITLFSFCLALFFTFGLAKIAEKVDKRALVMVGLIYMTYISFPAFQGNFYSPLLKLKVPTEYMATMNYLNTQNENQRVVLLPAYTFWNWEYRSWGQRGSGFWWYGIKQPLVMRAFDPWSNYNEELYNQLGNALNTEDSTLFKNTLDKYDITYLLLDKYMINNLSSKPFNYDKLNRFIQKLTYMKVDKAYGNIVLYKYSKSNTFVSSLSQDKTPLVYKNGLFEKKDNQYATLGNYISTANASTIYPLSTLYGEKLQEDNTFTINDNKDSIVLKPKNGSSQISSYHITIPNMLKTEYLLPVKLTIKGNSINFQIIYPDLLLNGQKVSITNQNITFSSAIQSPNKITLTDINQTISSGEEAYIRNNYKNTLEISDGVKSELYVLNTSGLASRDIDMDVLNFPINTFEVRVPKIKSPYTYENIIKKKDFEIKSPAKDLKEISNPKSEIYVNKNNPQNISFTVKRGNSVELTSWEERLPHQGSYLAVIESKYLSGLPVNFYLDNPYERKSEIDTKLSKKTTLNIIPIHKTEDYYQGYGFHFITKSVGNETAQNTISDFSVYPFPIDTIEQISFQTIDANTSTGQEQKKETVYEKLQTYSYLIKPIDSTYIVLSQSFYPDWKAYEINNYKSPFINFVVQTFPFMFGKELKDHVLVNNWANGWSFDQKQENKSIIVLFWPQYLEFIGLALLPLTIVFIIKKNLEN